MSLTDEVKRVFAREEGYDFHPIQSSVSKEYDINIKGQGLITVKTLCFTLIKKEDLIKSITVNPLEEVKNDS